MPVDKHRSYFVASSDTVMREEANINSAPVNHLIFGDRVCYLGKRTGNWAKVRCRGDDGWVLIGCLQEERVLEINFIDIGQGDGCHIVTPDGQVILVDAGIGDNMTRFLHWRYDLRSRRVAGVDGVSQGDPDVKPPIDINMVVITRPDKHHYLGFMPVFQNQKLKVHKVYHNGIIERDISPADKQQGLFYYSRGELGGWIEGPGKSRLLRDVMREDDATQALLSRHGDNGKEYITLLLEASRNNKGVEFHGINVQDRFLDKFDQQNELRVHILGPVTESGTLNGVARECLPRLGDEDDTRNGHSVMLKLEIGMLRVILAGEPNIQSGNYLLRHYCGTDRAVSMLEKIVEDLGSESDLLDSEEQAELISAKNTLEEVIAKGRDIFETDVLKVCNHGSHHLSGTFLSCLNAIATIVSGGDNETYAHPRPDALGAFGKYGRGARPLIFSTACARTTEEFFDGCRYHRELEHYQSAIDQASPGADRDKLKREMELYRDRSVAQYGMITLRSDGEKAIIAQKLAVAGGNDNKWDIHEMEYNPNSGQFEYHK